MKFSITKKALQKALRMVSGVAERRQNTNPVLANIFLALDASTLTVIATDQEIELTAKVDVSKATELGSALIPCCKLADICRVLPDDAEITIESSKEKTLIKAGKSRFVLSALPVEQFPKTGGFKEQQGFVVSRQAFMRLIGKTAFAMAEDDVRHFLNGMLFEIGNDFLRMVATDGHRLALQTMSFKDAGAPTKLVIPRKGVLEILRALGESTTEMVSVAFGGSCLQITCADLALTTVLLGCKYPDYEKVIPKRGDKIVCSSRETLKAAVHRAAALLNEKFKGVKLKLSNNGMKILAYNTEKDEAEEELAVEFAGADIELGFNARYLLEFLASVNASVVKMTFSEPNGSVLLEELGNNSGLCVVMPMRI